jgi:hypothetical protein
VRAVLEEAPIGPRDGRGLGGGWSGRRSVISVRPLVRRLVSEVARSWRVARSRWLP